MHVCLSRTLKSLHVGDGEIPIFKQFEDIIGTLATKRKIGIKKTLLEAEPEQKGREHKELTNVSELSSHFHIASNRKGQFIIDILFKMKKARCSNVLCPARLRACPLSYFVGWPEK